MLGPLGPVMRAAAFSGPAGTSTAILGGANLLGLLISLATGSHLHLDLIGTGPLELFWSFFFSWRCTVQIPEARDSVVLLQLTAAQLQS